MTNKERFLALVSNEKTNTLEKNREKIRNRAMLRESQQIAIKVLAKLDHLGWTQRELALSLEVSPQQVSKIVSGKENLTIETQIKLQTLLDIPILASYYENEKSFVIKSFNFSKESVAIVEPKNNTKLVKYKPAKTIKMEPKAYSKEAPKFANV
jgi:transcriptional regulator with XRE-family HTH domain